MSVESSESGWERVFIVLGVVAFAYFGYKVGVRNIWPETIEKLPAYGTNARLEYQIRSALGESDRVRDKITSLHSSDGYIELTFAIDGNPLEGWEDADEVRLRQDLRGVLKAVFDSGVEVKQLRIDGTFPRVDRFGNESEFKSARLFLSGIELAQINWKTFTPGNVYTFQGRSRRPSAVD